MAAINPTMKVGRAPASTIEKTSRPRGSVPSQCLARRRGRLLPGLDDSPTLALMFPLTWPPYNRTSVAGSVTSLDHGPHRDRGVVSVIGS